MEECVTDHTQWVWLILLLYTTSLYGIGPPNCCCEVAGLYFYTVYMCTLYEPVYNCVIFVAPFPGCVTWE